MNCERCGNRVEATLGGAGLCPMCLIAEIRGGVPDEDWVRVRFPQLEDAKAIEDACGVSGDSVHLRFGARDFESGEWVTLHLLDARDIDRGQLLGDLERRSHLDHPGIAQLLDHGEIDGFLYAIESVPDGEALEEKIRDAEIGRREMLAFLPKISELVRYAASKGVDLPGDPATVYVDEEGDVRLSGMPLGVPGDPEGAVERIAQHPTVGTRIAGYELLELLGEGGFAEVYRARQHRPVRREVALKILKLGMDTRQVLARFARERQALAQMAHSNIARVYDAGATPAGRPYIVMELVDGEPLTTYCDKRTLSLEARAALLAQLCRAVEHGHRKGVIHRDLKPSNVLVVDEDEIGVPKVIDFGIARVAEEPINANTFFTHAQQFIGSPSYMSPEQVGGESEIDLRSDVYSLGSLLYEQLTGEPPLPEEQLTELSLKEVIERVQDGEPDHPADRVAHFSKGHQEEVAALRSTEPRKLVGKLTDRGLSEIALKALSPRTVGRYASAAEMADDLERWVEDKTVHAPRRRRRAVHRLKKMGKWAALLAVGLGVAWYYSPLGRRISKSRAGDGTLRPVALYHFDGDIQSDIAGGPDLVAVGAPELSFETAEIAGSEAKVLHFPRFTPGQWLKLKNVIGVNGPWFATETNEFTLVYDVMFPEISGDIGLFQCHSENGGTAEMFVGPRGLGNRFGHYYGEIRPGEWNRIAIVSSTSDRAQLYAVYLNGTRLGIPWVKGRHSAGSAFDDEILIFADGDQRTGEGYLGSFAVYDLPLSDHEVRALGPATAEGVPQRFIPGPPIVSPGGLLARERVVHEAGTAGERFGSSVAADGADGARALVGAPGSDADDEDAGAVWEYRLVEGRWVPVAPLPSPAGLGRSARFGESVILRGDRALVLAPGGHGGGRAYLYQRDGDRWRDPILLAGEVVRGIGLLDNFAVAAGSDGGIRLFDSVTGAAHGFLGSQVAGAFAIGGGRLAVLSSGGEIAVFEEAEGDAPALVGIASFAASGGGSDSPGAALAVAPDGTRIAVAGEGGAVTLYAEGAGGEWAREGEVARPEEADTGDGFASALAFAAPGRLVVGAPRGTRDGKRTGVAYLYDAVGGEWALRRAISPAWGSVGEKFGQVLSLSGGRGWIGGPDDHTDRPFGGAAYPVELPRFEDQKFATQPPSFTIGSTVAISRGVAVVGSPGMDKRVSGGALLTLRRAREGRGWEEIEPPAPHADPLPEGSFQLVACGGDAMCVTSGLEILPYRWRDGRWRAGAAHDYADYPYALEQEGDQLLLTFGSGRVVLAKLTDEGIQLGVTLRGEGGGAVRSASLAEGLALFKTSGEAGVSVHLGRGETWTRLDDIPQPEDLPVGVQFGFSLAHDPHHAIIAAPAIDRSRKALAARGAAVIADLSGERDAAILTSPRSGLMPGFGWSVALAGDIAYIGAPYIDRGLSPGQVYEFRRGPGAGRWTHTATLEASNAEPGDEFGVSLDLDDGWLIVGAKSSWTYLFRVE